MFERLTGIGSRNAPESALKFMQEFVYTMAVNGTEWYTGGAPGMDHATALGAISAMEDCGEEGLLRVFLPEKRFYQRILEYPQGSCRYFDEKEKEVLAERLIASKVCKHINDVPPMLRNLFTRNVAQITGDDIYGRTTETEAVIYWAPEEPITGKVSGGTKYAVNLARSMKVDTFNIGIERDLLALMEFTGFEYDDNSFVFSYL